MLHEDVEVPANNIEAYLGVSGCIGDVPFSAMMANACGHSALKGCKFCFLLGQTKNSAQEKLPAVRFGGYDPEDNSTKAHMFTATGEWYSESVSFVKADGTFDKQQAEKVRVNTTQQAMRRQLADDVRAEAAKEVEEKNPLPQLPDGATSDQIETFQAGTSVTITCLLFTSKLVWLASN